MLIDGLYEQVINKVLENELSGLSGKLIETISIDPEESPTILSSYIAEIIKTKLVEIYDGGGNIFDEIDFCNRIIKGFSKQDGDKIDNLIIDKRAELLLALLNKKNSVFSINEKTSIIRPITSISQSSLFTGAIHEPSMVSELKKEILSCDEIDILVSFIKWSGIRLIIDELRDFTYQGRLRIITTSYMGATDVKAIEALQELPNTEIKISYDTKRTRLHAKTYVFYRKSGFTTAYIGSSNLSNAAISSGLEWNIKVTAKDLPSTIQKIEATFESYWNSSEFVLYSENQKSRLENAINAEKNNPVDNISFNFDIQPYPFQIEILDRLKAERSIHGHFRNLVVAATGTGKTVVSAFDYKFFRDEFKAKPNRLLFIAHREEILSQSIACFRAVLKDPNFGDLFVGNHSPKQLDYLFLSIQTFNSTSFCNKTSKSFYDFIIVDEFHHAAADTYQELLSYYEPKILIGLTATPERMDGKSIIEFFDNRIAAEIRLPEAINRKLLCPFQYFGVTDTVNLDEIRWVRGGYDKNDLSRLLINNDGRVKTIIEAINKYCSNISEIRGLGFCVSKEHAEYMSKVFNVLKIPSIFLTSDSDYVTRINAKRNLIDGKIYFIFVVDLYNEGVDIPEINTVLFLRPTESLTIFLQQLGRGLRLSNNKDCLTVLDFIGQANNKYDFEGKFEALLEKSRKSIHHEISDDFYSLPKGCFIQLEKKAKDYILENIHNAIGSRIGIISRVATFCNDTGQELNLANFINYYHIDLKYLYAKFSFSRVCALAGVIDNFSEPNEDLLTKALRRICQIDSRRWINFLIKILPEINLLNPNELSNTEKKYLSMLHWTIYQKSEKECGYSSSIESIMALKNNRVLFSEIIELLQVCFEKIDFIDEVVPLGFECPLDLHCTYSRDQILVALDYLKISSVRQGVLYLPNLKTDIFFITLNKTDKDYSPTTMYKDYSINEELFHWQSQSTTDDQSQTGQRYIHHRTQGSNVLLFVREFKSDIGGTAPYTFLGLVDYIHHEGNHPMNIIWKLHKPIPNKFLKRTNKLIAE